MSELPRNSRNLLKGFFRLFRVVNLPTVPGDVLAGAAVYLYFSDAMLDVPQIAMACLASVLIYMFGLADNDITGAQMGDSNRPIPDGQISLEMARFARFFTITLAMLVAKAAKMHLVWWLTAFFLSIAIVLYNRSKNSFLMGLCRTLNVILGGCVVGGAALFSASAQLAELALVVVALLVGVYITAITYYSKGEESDPHKKHIVGYLVGAIVYLQLVVLLIFPSKPLLIGGAVMLVLLRVLKRILPEVEPS